MSLTSRIMLPICLLLAFIHIVFSGTHIFKSFNEQKTAFEHRAQYLTSIAANSNVQQIWSLDLGSLIAFSESMAQEPLLAGILFYTDEQKEKGTVRVGGFIKGLGPFDEYMKYNDIPNIPTYSHHYQKDITFNETNIGTVHLYFNDASLKEALWSHIVDEVITLLLLIFILGGSIYFSLQRQLLHPFKQAHHMATHLREAFQSYSQSLEQQRQFNTQTLATIQQQFNDSSNLQNRSDEVGDFFRAFNVFITTVARLVNEISQYSDQMTVLNDELENRVKRRTGQLEEANEKLNKSIQDLQNTQERLVQQEKLASIGQLAAGVAHEINNPIGYVSSNLTSLSEYATTLLKLVGEFRTTLSLSPEQETGLQSLLESADFDFIKDDLDSLLDESKDGISKVKTIIQDLKDFSYTGTGKFALADLNNVIQKALNIAHNEIKYKAKVEKHLGDIPPIEMVESQISQVLLNLLVNAAHAIESQGTISVSTRQSGEQIEIDVQDTGSGIAPENISKLFDPFFTTKEIGKGTGLGLSISYGILQRHHGDIRVASKMGEGTTFTLVIPVHQPEVPRQQTAS